MWAGIRAEGQALGPPVRTRAPHGENHAFRATPMPALRSGFSLLFPVVATSGVL
jgi:hypothetical protein